MTTADYLTQLQQDREDLVDNLEAKGITGLTGDETFTELVPEVLNINGGDTPEAEEKDVNFYDYDGTRVYSYTKTEFLALESMPENPTHDGLTAQGWNWNLTTAKTHVTENTYLDIGQLYVTTDGKTRLYIELTNYYKSPYLGLGINGTITIDWGDGTSDTVTGSSETTAVFTQHNYSTGGKYTITITPPEENNKVFRIFGGGFTGSTLYGTYLLRKSTNTSDAYFNHIVYSSTLKKVELGNKVKIGDFAFYFCYSLETISIPKNALIQSKYTVASCTSLKHFTVEDSSSVLTYERFFNGSGIKTCAMSSFYATFNSSEYLFQNCLNLKRIIIPQGTRGVATYCCSGLRELRNIKIPSAVTQLYNYAFSNCYNLEYIDFSSHTSIPTLGTGVFNVIPSEFKIIVPDNLYDNWKTASGWSTYANNIISKSDWDALQ